MSIIVPSNNKCPLCDSELIRKPDDGHFCSNIRCIMYKTRFLSPSISISKEEYKKLRLIQNELQIYKRALFILSKDIIKGVKIKGFYAKNIVREYFKKAKEIHYEELEFKREISDKEGVE